MSSLRLLLAASRPLHRTYSRACTSHLRAQSTMTASGSSAEVAVIGGGVAGLACALQLASRGLHAAVFDMGTRVAGGRCSSREQSGGLAFDHGCQVLVPRGALFRAQVDEWLAAGALQQWAGRFGWLDAAAGTFQRWPAAGASEAAAAGASRPPSTAGFLAALQPGPLYVGVPSMQAICAHMVQQLEGSGLGRLALSTKVEAAEWDEERGVWRLRGSPRGRAAAAEPGGGGQQELGEFRALVAADSLTLLPDSAGYAGLCGPTSHVASVAQRIQESAFDPVFSLMVAYEQPLGGLPFDAAAVGGGSGAWQWVACNSSKPGRPADGPQCWVAVTTPSHARRVMERFPLHVQGQYNPQTREYLKGVAGELYGEFEALLAPFMEQAGLPRPLHLQAQRWGRGFIQRPLGVPCLAVPKQRFAACGDFCLGPAAEDAWLSGRAAAEEVAGFL